ncbi:MAG: F0F1 ATP synthase subunit B [Chloroflexi bacterium]|nr:F0F1 ATP synthase subunit B [Chloroflexota bacterium]MCL5076395.1 F0F1 ATP synthase subunit B [Chloroflexota bacterium]
MGALGALGIDSPVLIAQAINFVLLLALAYIFLYKPILKVLDRRSAHIRMSMERVEHIKEEAERIKKEHAAQMEQSRREGQAIIAQATEAAERIRREAQAQSQAQAEEFLARARAQIERERQKAIVDLHAQIADLAILAASKVVRRTLDTSTHAQLIEEVLAETEELHLS